LKKRFYFLFITAPQLSLGRLALMAKLAGGLRADFAVAVVVTAPH
jgi:hypothetical protein